MSSLRHAFNTLSLLTHWPGEGRWVPYLTLARVSGTPSCWVVNPRLSFLLILPTRRRDHSLMACPNTSRDRDPPSVNRRRQTRLKTLPSLVFRTWSVKMEESTTGVGLSPILFVCDIPVNSFAERLFPVLLNDNHHPKNKGKAITAKWHIHASKGMSVIRLLKAIVGNDITIISLDERKVLG